MVRYKIPEQNVNNAGGKEIPNLLQTCFLLEVAI